MNEISLMPAEQYQRLQQRNAADVKELWDLLDMIKDPELPVLSIWDLGILRDIKRDGDRITVTITPTYSGCPAMDNIRTDVEKALNDAGYQEVTVNMSLSPAWSSEWMSPEGRKNLREYGIAPPEDADLDEDGLTPEAHAQCPHCRSRNTRRISEFGSTACKALFQCNDCNEPFDYFKKI
ncbi:MAG: phenylacetate-CoA oxygenase subunit PaaJ [Amphritea sp.]|nr:phenylacetate-CoA oxygenase subunit PaaJ [Amphritea sp.]MBQ0785270.1 phenylacetate-CoA oxygenase subunit PaaJ [Amphritea sp.]